MLLLHNLQPSAFLPLTHVILVIAILLVTLRFTFVVSCWYVVMLVGLSRTAVSATSALLFLLTVIISTVIMFILFLSEINWIGFDNTGSLY